MKKNRCLAAFLAAVALWSVGCSAGGTLEPETDLPREKTVMTEEIPCESKRAEVPDHLTRAPVYALPENATEQEARAMCVMAMEDQLTFCWTPARDATLIYTQLGSNRDTTFYASKAYAGMPYAGGGTGLLQALEYYDFETGVMDGLPWDNINEAFGNTCATAVNWALSSVCPSICGTQTSSVTPSFGYVTVGEVALPEDLTVFSNDANSPYTTHKAVEATDEQALYRAYAQMLPADVFISVGSMSEGPHAMMCYEKPEVATLPDGSVDPDNSFAVVIDQRISNRETVIHGTTYLMRGRIGGKISFTELRQKDYLPLRPADLANWRGSVKATSALDREASSLAQLREATLLSNYRLARVTLNVVSDSGEAVYQGKRIISQELYREKRDRAYALSSLVPRAAAIRGAIREDGIYFVEVKSLLATGEEFTPARFPLDLGEL